MNSCGVQSRKLYIYGLLFVSAVLPALLAVKNIAISPDSMMYSLVSQELLSGNGIKLPIIYSLKDNYNFSNGAVPFVLQPPLFPILLAVLGGAFPQSLLAAQILNVIAHIVITTFTFLLMKKIYNNIGVALLTGILVSTSVPILHLTHSVLSDAVCIAFTVAAIYFLTLSVHTDRYQFNWHLLTASVCTSAAILTRFAGIGLLPVFLWQVFLLIKNKMIKLTRISMLLTVALPLIACGSIFIATYIISGSISGWEPPSPERSYFESLIVTLKMIFLQFRLNENLIVPTAAIVISCVLYILINTNTRKELLKYVHSGLDVVIVFMICHTMLIVHAMATSQTVVEPRYVSALIPFLFTFVVLIIFIIGHAIERHGFSKLAFGGIIFSLAIMLLGNVYKTYSNSEPLFSKRSGHYRILNSPTYRWLKENYREGVIVTTNRPWHLAFFGGYSTIRLPHRRFNKNYRIPDNMESYLPKRMSFFGSKIVALFEVADEQNEGTYVAGLFNKRRDDDNFTLVHEFSDGVIYKLKE